MITKFGNLEDLFDFLELKRAEIIKDYGLEEYENKDFEIEIENSDDIDFEMTTEEPEQPEQKHEKLHTAKDYIANISDNIIDSQEDLADNDFGMTEESSLESELIQLAWSTSMETPQKATDTTMIMEQLNLNESEFDCIDDDLIDGYLEEGEGEELENDPLGLDSLAFPMSQFPADIEDGPSEGDIESDGILDEIISDFELDLQSETIKSDKFDEFDFDITMSQIPSTQAAIPPSPIQQQFPISFSTGKGVKLPPPSESALCKAQLLTKSVEHDPEIKQEPQQPISVGFKTGKGIDLPPPSKEAMKRARSLVELDENEFDNATVENNESKEFPMFTTAKGKALPPPSEEAMKRAKSLTEAGTDITYEVKNENRAFPSFSTGRGKVLPPPSKEAIERANRVIMNDGATDNSKFVVGFNTGRGKALPPPSEEALKRANELINDTMEISPMTTGFSTGKGKALPPPSKKALERMNDSGETVPITAGFATGRGKALPSPSEEALERASKLINEAPFENENIKPVKSTVPVPTNKKPSVPGNTAFKPPSLIKSTSAKAPPTPFSLSTAWKRPRRPNLTVKPEPVKLFDLSTEGMQRFKLKEFFNTTPNLTISDYSGYGIPDEILRINSGNAKDFRFKDGWGVEEAHENLLKNGAKSVSISLEWTRNHYRWIIWKFASILRCFPEKYSIANLSPGWVLQQLLYRYEREVNQCSRSALKKIIERDDAAGKYLCLLVSGIDKETRSLELSDGWYSIWTSKLDFSFWDLIEAGNKKIFEGMKIEISGASLTGQDGIPALEAASKSSQCRLIISRNSCRPARWDTKLGFICTGNRSVAFLKHLHQIHPQGGPIPAVSLVIDRVYPLLYKEITDSSTSSGVVSHVARNERDHYLYLETNPEQASKSKFTPIQRIRVLGNCEKDSTALISFWNPLGEDQRALLQEGTAVIITNLRANSKMRTSHLTLVSSKSTRIFKANLIKTGNKIDNLRVVDLENYSLLSNLKLNESFDVQGVALGRVGSFFWFGGVNKYKSIDSPTFLICLKNFNYTSVKGEIINFRDLTFNHFDGKEGVAHFTFTEYSDFKKENTKPAVESFNSSIIRFKELTNMTF